MTRHDEPEEDRHLRELDALLAAAPALDVAKLDHDLEGLSLTDWARRTIAAAEKAGRPDVVAELRLLLQRTDDAQAELDAATKRRLDAESSARDYSNRRGDRF